ILASNLGRQITDLDLANRDTLTKDLLGDNRYQHRTRYVRFPDEPHDGRYAASAGDIAKIITKIIEKKVSQGRDHAQATVDSVHDALRGTSFLPPSRFQMPENADDAAYFIEAMEKISNSRHRRPTFPNILSLSPNIRFTQRTIIETQAHWSWRFTENRTTLTVGIVITPWETQSFNSGFHGGRLNA